MNFVSRTALRGAPLETPRLRLAPLDPIDAPELFRGVEASRAALEPWLPWVPYQTTEGDSRAYAECSIDDWDAGRALRLTLRDRERNTLLGIVSLESANHAHLSLELGYWIRTDVAGQGLMTEAAAATVQWAFRAVGAHRVRVAASTENARSLGVIRKLGFSFEGVARHAELIMGRWLDHAVFAKLSTDP